jgi:hypothetical protein
MAEQESRGEQHARLVVERAGGPRFVQRERLPDGGRVVRWDPDSEAAAQISDALNQQLERFREKFGREPGPEEDVLEPVEFDLEESPEDALKYVLLTLSVRQLDYLPQVLELAKRHGLVGYSGVAGEPID